LIPYYIFHVFIIGTAAFGLWVAGHECGHFSFSDNKNISDFVGLIMHSIVLTPYFAW